VRREVVFDHLYNVSSAADSGLLRSAWMSTQRSQLWRESQ
jgi:hypothetical protein